MKKRVPRLVQHPRRTLKPALMEPYVYPVGSKDVLMTTMVTPILVGGRFVGAAGADLPLDRLSQKLAQLEPVPGGRVSLLTNGGQYVADPDVQRLGKKADDLPPAVLESVAQGEARRREDAQGRVHLFGPVKVLEGTPAWSAVISYPKSVAPAAVRSTQQLYAALLAAAVACGLAAVLMVLLVRSLMRPLREGGATMASLASGDTDLDVTLPERGRDELTVIARGFNGFASKLRTALGAVGEVSSGVANASSEIASGNADLSSRTEQQASHLQQSASAVRELSEGVALSAESSEQAARLAREAVRQAESTLNGLGEAVQHMDHLLSEVSVVTREQSGRIQSVTYAIGELDQNTQQNATIVEQAAAAADSLRQHSARLVKTVQQFIR